MRRTTSHWLPLVGPLITLMAVGAKHVTQTRIPFAAKCGQSRRTCCTLPSTLVRRQGNRVDFIRPFISTISLVSSRSSASYFVLVWHGYGYVRRSPGTENDGHRSSLKVTVKCVCCTSIYCGVL